MTDSSENRASIGAAVNRLSNMGTASRQCPVPEISICFAAGQLAVFQGGPSRTGGCDERILKSIRKERATRKNSQLATAQRVAMKMGRRLRCSSVTFPLRYAPSTASPARTALPAAHFDRNGTYAYFGDRTLGAGIVRASRIHIWAQRGMERRGAEGYHSDT